jgi:hypothetical protein
LRRLIYGGENLCGDYFACYLAAINFAAINLLAENNFAAINFAAIDLLAENNFAAIYCAAIDLCEENRFAAINLCVLLCGD